MFWRLLFTLFCTLSRVVSAEKDETFDALCVENEINSLLSALDTSLVAPQNISQSSMDPQTRTYARQVINAMLKDIGTLEYCHSDGKCVFEHLAEIEQQTKFLLMTLDNVPAKGIHKKEMGSIIKSIEHVYDQQMSSVAALPGCFGEPLIGADNPEMF